MIHPAYAYAYLDTWANPHNCKREYKTKYQMKFDD